MRQSRKTNAREPIGPYGKHQTLGPCGSSPGSRCCHVGRRIDQCRALTGHRCGIAVMTGSWCFISIARPAIIGGSAGRGTRSSPAAYRTCEDAHAHCRARARRDHAVRARRRRCPDRRSRPGSAAPSARRSRRCASRWSASRAGDRRGWCGCIRARCGRCRGRSACTGGSGGWTGRRTVVTWRSASAPAAASRSSTCGAGARARSFGRAAGARSRSSPGSRRAAWSRSASAARACATR